MRNIRHPDFNQDRLPLLVKDKDSCKHTRAQTQTGSITSSHCQVLG